MPSKFAQSVRKFDAVILDLYGTLINLPDAQERGRIRMANLLGVELGNL